MTNSTYSIHSFSGLSIFDLHNDPVLLKNLDGINSSPTTNLLMWYHDIEKKLLYFINATMNCTILSLNLGTPGINSFTDFDDSNICRGRIIQIGSAPGELVIQAYANSFLILTEQHLWTSQFHCSLSISLWLHQH